MADGGEQRDALKARVAELEAAAGRHLVTQRDLSRAKDQVDIELARFDVIQGYVAHALEAESEAAFMALTLETLIEAFEYEVALFLVPSKDRTALVVGGSFGFVTDPGPLPSDTDWFDGADAIILDEADGRMQAWSALDMQQAIHCPIIGSDGRLEGVIVAGITRASVDLFNPIDERDRSAFSVLVRQAGGLWANRKLTDDIAEKSRRLETETASQLVMQRDLVKAKGLVDSELARFNVLQSYISRALAIEGDDAFFALTLEALIEAFEYEVALFLRVSQAPATLDVVSQFGFAGTPPTLELPKGGFPLSGVGIMDRDSGLLADWAELALSQVIICPIHDKNDELSGALLGGITIDSEDFYDPIAEEQVSAFSVMVRQAGAIWMNRELNEEVRKHNARLMDLTNSYSRFVPFQFLELLERQSIEEINTGDSVRIETSVLFLDIRGFTTLSQRLGAEGIFTNLNEFLRAMEPLIAEQGGFINQYLGDAIMALFPETCDAALHCANDMLSKATTFNDERVARDAMPIRFGVGISSGPLMLGAIGGGERLDSNVIGDTANLASRTEGLTKFYGADCIFTEMTKEGLVNPDDFSFRELDRVIVKGRETAVSIYELLGDDDPRIATSEAFNEGLSLYREGVFKPALDAFQKCLCKIAHDQAARLYVKRCKELSVAPTPNGWDGVWALDHK